jgi:hypothetical protein
MKSFIRSLPLDVLKNAKFGRGARSAGKIINMSISPASCTTFVQPKALPLSSMLFWTSAGLWNIIVASAFWNRILSNDIETKESLPLRVAVILFGCFYALIAVFPSSFYWLAVIGALLKLKLAYDHFSVPEKRTMSALSFILFGDFVWAIGFFWQLSKLTPLGSVAG